MPFSKILKFFHAIDPHAQSGEYIFSRSRRLPDERGSRSASQCCRKRKSSWYDGWVANRFIPYPRMFAYAPLPPVKIML